MNEHELIAFLLAAVALLGSPGPAIAALLAVGRTYGWKGLTFFWGLQLGLASAAGLTALGLFAILSAFPWALLGMSLVATAYLLYLAYKVGTAPVGQAPDASKQSPKLSAGLLLGLTNPKAYLSFASLFASFQLLGANTALDSSFKWILIVFVMIVADILWLWVGVTLGRLNMSNAVERAMNLTMAAAIVFSAVYALL